MTLRNLFVIATLLIVSTSARAEKVLMIGDSISCGPFGRQMVKNLAQGGANDVTLYCAISSAPTHWINGTNPPGQKCQTMTSTSMTLQPCGGDGKVPKLATILAKHTGARMIVALGTNSLGSKKTDHSYQLMAQAVSEAGSQCQWIGPPHIHPAQAKGFSTSHLALMESNTASFRESLESSVSSICPVVDSRPFTSDSVKGYHTADGVHPTSAGGILWADKIMSQVNGPYGDGSVARGQSSGD